MKFGLMFFNSGAPSLDVWNRDFNDAIEQTILAEEEGFSTVLVGEHHFTEQGYIASPNTICGMIAGRTNKIRIGTGVILLPLHHPVSVAEETTLIDRISNGRYILGVGLGYRLEEFAGFNANLELGAEMLEEGLVILNQLLSKENVTFGGKYYHFKNLTVTPRPLQKPRPPIWIGAKANAPVRRAARLGDVWFMDPVTPLKILKQRMAIYEAELKKVGKSLEVEKPLRREAYVAKDSDTAWKEGGVNLLHKWRNYFNWGHVQDEDGNIVDPKTHDFDSVVDMMKKRYILGDPDEVIEQVERCQKELGATELVFQLQFPGMSHENTVNAIKLIGKKIIPYFESQNA